jgi:hypothetical protein
VAYEPEEKFCKLMDILKEPGYYFKVQKGPNNATSPDFSIESYIYWDECKGKTPIR